MKNLDRKNYFQIAVNSVEMFLLFGGPVWNLKKQIVKLSSGNLERALIQVLETPSRV